MRQPPPPPLPSRLGVRVRRPPVAVIEDWIYTLDDCIMYTKEPNIVLATKVVNKGRTRKEPEPSVS